MLPARSPHRRNFVVPVVLLLLLLLGICSGSGFAAAKKHVSVRDPVWTSHSPEERRALAESMMEGFGDDNAPQGSAADDGDAPRVDPADDADSTAPPSSCRNDNADGSDVGVLEDDHKADDASTNDDAGGAGNGDLLGDDESRFSKQMHAVSLVPDEEKCTALRAIYHEAESTGKKCTEDSECKALSGMCSVGLGGCHIAAGPALQQQRVARIGSEFTKFCKGGGVCRCAAPRPVRCAEGACAFT